MVEQGLLIYQFGPFRLDARKRELLRGDEPVRVFPKELDLLLALVERPGEVITKDELIQKLWGDSFIEEGNLATYISHLRRALGESRARAEYIVTVPGRGYRFVADVMVLTPNECSPGHPEPAPLQTTESQEEPARVSSTWNLSVFRAMAVLALVLTGGLASFILSNVSAVDNGPPSQITSIAILPFKPLIAADRDESFELGMAETLITKLSSARQLAVRPLSAVRKYTDPDQDPVAAGAEQRVDAVLDGNIQKSGGQVRVSMQLLRVRDGTPIWADRFDEPLTDIFALQDVISERVTRALRLSLTADEQRLFAKHETDNPEAYQLYVRGRYFLEKDTVESAKASIGYFDDAVRIAPRYAKAHAGLADAQILLALSGSGTPEGFREATASATKALELDANLADAHVTLAVIAQGYDFDWIQAERHLKRAIELSPNHARVRQAYSDFLAVMGRFDEAIIEARRALELDPVSLTANTGLGITFYLAREYEAAIEQINKTLALDSNFGFAHFVLGSVYLQIGKNENAIAELQKARIQTARADLAGPLGFAYARAGHDEKVKEILAELQHLSKHQYVPPITFALIYSGSGDHDRAFHWLDKMRSDRQWHVRLLKTEPIFDRLRTDPRFEVLLRRTGLL